MPSVQLNEEEIKTLFKRFTAQGEIHETFYEIENIVEENADFAYYPYDRSYDEDDEFDLEQRLRSHQKTSTKTFAKKKMEK